MADFSPDHEALGSLPMVTTHSAMSTLATPGRANSRSPSGEPAARSLLPKKNGPPGCKLRLTVNLHVSGSASESLRADADRQIHKRQIHNWASDIFDAPLRSARA